MKRFLVSATAALLLGTAAYALITLSRERGYRRFIETGNAALASEQTFEAIEAFSGAIALKGDSMLGYLRRGETYHRQGQLQAAERDLRRAWHLDPTATRPIDELGDVQFELGNFARAADRYADYIALDDSSPRVFYKLALARYRAGNQAGAVDPLTRAVELDEALPEAHYLLGVCLRDAHRLDEARRALERAVSLSPGLVAAREELIGLYQETGQVDREVDQLEALSSLDPRPSRRIALGLAQARAGRHNQAVETLRRAAERYPEYGPIYVALGRIWLENSQGGRDRVALRKALEALEAPAAAADETHQARSLFGRALFEASDVEMAERVLRQAVATVPADPEAFLSLADAAEQLGHLADARSALLRYQALVGDDPNTSRQARRAGRIGELSLKLADYAAAAEWFAQAVAASPPSAQLLAQLADAQVRVGNVEAARATLARGLELEPRNHDLLVLQRKVQ